MTAHSKQGDKVLDALLERLYTALARGPAINAYPGNSRQRVDLAGLDVLGGPAGTEMLRAVLGESKRVAFKPEIERLPPRDKDTEEPPELGARRRLADRRWRMLRKLATIASDADLYLKDTGSYVLYIGYPLLWVPESQARLGSGPNKVLAPLAFIPIALNVAAGARPSLAIECSESGADRVQANAALKAWVERQLDVKFPELFEDEEGSDPLREISELMAEVAQRLEIASPPDLAGWPVEGVPDWKQMPEKAAIIPSAVIGLFPLRNQSVLVDMEEFRKAPSLPDTVMPFVTLDATLTTDEEDSYAGDVKDEPRVELPSSADEHLIDLADPCQRRAVIRSRTSKGLVVHGPPGTGKSQTITNIIGDYLARGKRVLLVCEKRTALDVVKYRLDAKGLGHLCAVVHDATHDRQGLYMGIRDQLEGLADARPFDDRATDLQRINAEIDRTSAELHDYFARLDKPEEKTRFSLHELTGRWLQAGGLELGTSGTPLDDVDPEAVFGFEGDLRTLHGRLEAANYPDNAWIGAAGLTIDDWLAKSPAELGALVEGCIAAAGDADSRIVEGLPPYDPNQPLTEQAAARAALGTELQRLAKDTRESHRHAIGSMAEGIIDEALGTFPKLDAMRTALSAAPLDANLQLTFSAAPWPHPQVVAAMRPLAEYIEKGGGFMGLFRFGVKSRARAVLQPLGLGVNVDDARKALAFLEGVNARLMLRRFLDQYLPEIPTESSDAMLAGAFDSFRSFAAMLNGCRGTEMHARLKACLDGKEDLHGLGRVLEETTGHAEAADKCAQAARDAGIFSADAIRAWEQTMCACQPLSPAFDALRRDLPRLEGWLRFLHESAKFPAAISTRMQELRRAGMDGDAAWKALLASLYHAAIQRVLRAEPQLQRLDPDRLEKLFKRMRELSGDKNRIEAEQICFQWQQRQRARLLAGTGSRLNTEGGNLKRRLLLRGRNASRIRQVIHEGRSIEGGDPIFDINPIWLTSPETAAQILPMEPLFDVIVFDEASQCRLEEGLPVLARGERVVIAGDTKQLPPTSFFQSAVVSSSKSDDDEDGAEMDSLFQSRQSEIEDLLGAALNIDIEQSFLDVHYRSVHEMLIDFSNKAFYGHRLQAVPGHPNSRPPAPALQLHQVDGVYEDRQNAREADYVVARVKELLSAERPPTIGIVTFNLTQRDLIDEKFQEAMDADDSFARALEEARARQSQGSFQGLFVKNLENVQGDERDHIIISTTFGPGPDGKFHKRFGPLGATGGERRLNVIVTRARQRLDVVTSIPPAVYREIASQQAPAGQKPNGAWYLMKYLAAAEQGTRDYSAPQATSAGLPDRGETTTPSLLVESLRTLAEKEQKLRGVLYYGNDGFSVDYALANPKDPSKVGVGVLVDSPRYAGAQDKVEWDVFKRGILEWKGWEIHRVWAPHFLRDPQGTVKQLAKHAGEG